MNDLYRVGRHQPQNVYRGEQYIGVMFSPIDAAAFVSTMNAFRVGSCDCETNEPCQGQCCGVGMCSCSVEPERKGQPDALIDAEGDRWDRIGPDEFGLGPEGTRRTRSYIESKYGRVTEVWT